MAESHRQLMELLLSEELLEQRHRVESGNLDGGQKGLFKEGNWRLEKVRLRGVGVGIKAIKN